MISLNSKLVMLSIRLRTQYVEKGPDHRPDTFQTFQRRFLLSQKVTKWTKEVAILIIIKEGCSILSFWSPFYCFIDSVVLFTFSGTSLHRSHRALAWYLQCKVILMMHCKVLLYCIWKGFEAIFMFQNSLLDIFFVLPKWNQLEIQGVSKKCTLF